jgi:hypothetical protein
MDSGIELNSGLTHIIRINNTEDFSSSTLFPPFPEQSKWWVWVK